MKRDRQKVAHTVRLRPARAGDRLTGFRFKGELVPQSDCDELREIAVGIAIAKKVADVT